MQQTNDNFDYMTDLARDDLRVIATIERDLAYMCNYIKRQITNHTLRCVDGVLLATRFKAMEMILEEILGPDKQRLEAAVRGAA